MAVDSGKFDEATYGTERVLRGHGGETHQRAGDGRPALTTQQGTVVADDQNSLRIGERGLCLVSMGSATYLAADAVMPLFR